MRGLGSVDHPALVCSQQAYPAPFAPTISIYPGERFREQGCHLIYVPGLATIWHTPAQLGRRIRSVWPRTPGVWFYVLDRWYDRNLDKNHYEPKTSFDKREYTVRKYIEAMGNAFEQLREKPDPQ